MKMSNKLIREINTTLRRYNAKIRRLEKQANKNIVIPERITKSAFEDYETSKDIRRRLRSLQRFSKRGAEKAMRLESGELVSVWEKKEHDILKRTALAKISRQLKYYETHRPRVYGKVQDTTFAKTGDEAFLRLIAERNRLKTRGLQKREQMIRENKLATRIVYQKDRQFRQNYYKMLDDIAGMLGQKDKAKEIKAQLDKLTDKEFVDFFNDDKGINAITFFYQTIEDNLFYANYDYIKTNFNLMHEHLTEQSMEDVVNLHDLQYDNEIDDNLNESKQLTDVLEKRRKKPIKLNIRY